MKNKNKPKSPRVQIAALASSYALLARSCLSSSAQTVAVNRNEKQYPAFPLDPTFAYERGWTLIFKLKITFLRHSSFCSKPSWLMVSVCPKHSRPTKSRMPANSQWESKLELIIYTTLIFVDYWSLLSRSLAARPLGNRFLSLLCFSACLTSKQFFISPKSENTDQNLHASDQIEGPLALLLSWKMPGESSSTGEEGENKNMIKLIFVSYFYLAPEGKGQPKWGTGREYSICDTFLRTIARKQTPVSHLLLRPICRWYFNNELKMLLNKINVFSTQARIRDLNSSAIFPRGLPKLWNLFPFLGSCLETKNKN